MSKKYKNIAKQQAQNTYLLISLFLISLFYFSFVIFSCPSQSSVSLISLYTISFSFFTIPLFTKINKNRYKTRISQINLLISVISFTLLSTAVVIQTIGNASNISGDAILNYTLEPTNTIEKTEIIEVWANTHIELSYNDSLINAKLLMDDGSILSNHTINFYADEILIGANSTDESGNSVFAIQAENITHTIKSEFLGNNEYLNPSEAELDITGETAEENITEGNETYINIDLIAPENVTRGENFTIIAIATGFNVSNVTLQITIPEEFTILSGDAVILCESIDSCKNELSVSTQNATAGEKEVKAFAYSGEINSSINKTILVTERLTNETIIIREIETTQGDVQIGNPVKWNKKIEVINPNSIQLSDVEIELPIPEKSQEIFIKKISKEPRGIFSISGEGKIKLPRKRFNEGKISANSSVSYEIEYETPAPTKEEIVSDEGKLIIISSNLTDVHYTNISVQTEAVEVPTNTSAEGKTEFLSNEDVIFKIKTPSELKVYWKGGSENVHNDSDITNLSSIKDVNLDGSPDIVEFTVPALSEQDYLITAQAKENITAYAEHSSKDFNATPEIKSVSGGYLLTFPRDKIKPGVYRLVVDSGSYHEELWFQFGLISINTKKSIYHPEETAEIIMVVLDKYGHLVSNANVSLNVTAPSGINETFSTEDKTIKEETKGVYKAYYNTTEEGTYLMHATSIQGDVNASITSYFLVKNYYEFDILREMPVTLDPWKNSLTASIGIISYTEAETFDFVEVLPQSFEVVDSGGAVILEQNNSKFLIWKNLESDSTVSYTANLPLVTPYLYEIGPAQVLYEENSTKKIFTEARPWLLAADPLTDIGMIAYGNSTQRTPNYRTWDGTTWSAPKLASDVGGTITWVVLEAFPNSDTKPRFEEYIMGTQIIGNVSAVQVYNGTGWGAVTNLTNSTGSSRRSFDIAYEQLSGKALVVYANNSANLSYRIWNGSQWSSERAVKNNQTLGNVTWVKLASRPYSNEIALMFLQSTYISANLSVSIWNGSDWGSEPSGGLEVGSAIASDGSGEGDQEAFSLAYEQLSGDLLVVWGLDASPYMRYATKEADSSTWTTSDAPASMSDEASITSLKPDPYSNRIAFASISSSNDDMQGAIWDGDADVWTDIRDNMDTGADTWALNDRLVDIGWIGATSSLVLVYQDDTTGIDYWTWAYGSGWISYSDFTMPAAAGTDQSDQLYTFPEDDLALLIRSDSNNLLLAYTFDGSTWESVNPSPNITTTISSTVYEPFMFAFKQFMASSLLIQDIIPIYNGQEIQNIEAGDTLTVNVSVKNLATSNKTANITLEITDPTGAIKYNTTAYKINISANGTIVLVNFSNISTASWVQGSYQATARAYWPGGNSTRTEDEAFEIASITVKPYYPLGQCLNTNYSMYVVVNNTWNSQITVSITPYNPSVWNFVPYNKTLIVPANSYNTTVFNLTTPSSTNNYTLNINGSYVDGNSQSRNSSSSLTFLVPGPVIRVTTEAPTYASNATDIYPRFIVHNYGCGLAQNIEFNETVPAGFYVDSSYTTSSGASKIESVSGGTRIVWDIERLAVNEFSFFDYKVQTSPTDSASYFGPWTLNYNDSGDNNLSDEEETLRPITSDTSTNGYGEVNVTLTTSTRSVLPNKITQYNVTVRNVGNTPILAGIWNFSVTLETRTGANQTWDLDRSCNITNMGNAFSWDNNTRKLIFALYSRHCSWCCESILF